MDKRKVIFLDRDGVINRRAAEHEYIYEWESFAFLPGAIEAVRELCAAGYLVIIVSNQRGIARGIYTKAQVDALHERMCREMRQRGADIWRVYICPHDDGECECRKPKPGMLKMAERELAQEGIQIEKAASWMVGDARSDVLAGRAYGVRTVLIGERQDDIADLTAADLKDAAKKIIGAKR